MQDRPTYLELLAAVQNFLENEIVPALDGTKKFHARVAANVIGIVSRELQDEGARLSDEWRRLDGLMGVAPLPAAMKELEKAIRTRSEELCERIRRGDADTGPFREATVAHLRQTVREKLMVANPKMLRDS